MYNSENQNSDFIQLAGSPHTWLHRNIDIIIAYVENQRNKSLVGFKIYQLLLLRDNGPFPEPTDGETVPIRTHREKKTTKKLVSSTRPFPLPKVTF